MTATPGASKRLATPGNSEDGQVLAPKSTTKSRALTTGSNTSISDVSADPTSPTQVTKSGKFYPDGPGQDFRGNQVQLITLADNAGADTWTITVYQDGALVTAAR